VNGSQDWRLCGAKITRIFLAAPSHVG
jgi:hypothetical protein